MKKTFDDGNRLKGWSFIAVFLATAFFVSYLPAKLTFKLSTRAQNKALGQLKWTGAGLVGTIWGAFTYLLLPVQYSQSIFIIVIAALFSCLIADRAEKALKTHDDPRIVIDEWIGMWIAAYGLTPEISSSFLLAFLLFRMFDVLKGPWGHALQKLPGGWGIVADDIFAGILANLILRFIFLLFAG